MQGDATEATRRQLQQSEEEGDDPKVHSLKQPQEQEQDTEGCGETEMADGTADGPAGGGEEAGLG